MYFSLEKGACIKNMHFLVWILLNLLCQKVNSQKLCVLILAFGMNIVITATQKLHWLQQQQQQQPEITVMVYITETSNTKISILGPDPSTDFLVDNVTLYEVPENSNWRTEADTNIENHRKSDIQLK